MPSCAQRHGDQVRLVDPRHHVQVRHLRWRPRRPASGRPARCPAAATPVAVTFSTTAVPPACSRPLRSRISCSPSFDRPPVVPAVEDPHRIDRREPRPVGRHREERADRLVLHRVRRVHQARHDDLVVPTRGQVRVRGQTDRLRRRGVRRPSPPPAAPVAPSISFTVCVLTEPAFNARSRATVTVGRTATPALFVAGVTPLSHPRPTGARSSSSAGTPTSRGPTGRCRRARRRRRQRPSDRPPGTRDT